VNRSADVVHRWTGDPAARLTITPAESTFSLGRRVPFTATVYDARDSVITAASITWGSTAAHGGFSGARRKPGWITRWLAIQRRGY
jgi:hypothetical protein